MLIDRGNRIERVPSLRVAAFLDGSPGHEKQTRGILKALQRIQPLEVTEIVVARNPFWRVVREWGRFFLGQWPDLHDIHEQYDLLIGTGTHTHLPMLAYKRQTDALCVTCMTPARPLVKHFDLCFVPQHDGVPAGGNIVVTLGPPNCSEPGDRHDPQKAMILLGGVDPKSHRWSSVEICAALRHLIENEKQKHWIISSSPRTPIDTVTLIEQLTAGLKNVEFFHYKDTPPGWIEKQYEENETVWVTADSMSMVYEALTAGCRVGILPVVWKNSENKFNRSEKYLLDQGFVVSFQEWKDGTAEWRRNKPLDEASRCAEEILKKWQQRN